MVKKIILTCGDINGIGPEIAIKSINENFDPLKYKFVFVVPRNVFLFYSEKINIDFEYSFVKKEISSDANIVDLIDIGDVKMNIGRATAHSGKTAYESIMTALKIAEEDTDNSIIVTSPISKSGFELAKISFPGHTELLAEYFNAKNYAMIFVGKEFNAALLTIHIPLKNVPSEITTKKLKTFLRFLKGVLQKDFKIKYPKIAVLGLNPHAGENGRIGKEENEIISPAIENLDFAFGPFVPDAFFGTRKYGQFDIVLGMYHDQVLIPFKMLEMYSGVNFTAGLPVVRTSPDHGTAFDIAGKVIANHNSMSMAIRVGYEISKNRDTNG